MDRFANEELKDKEWTPSAGAQVPLPTPAANQERFPQKVLTGKHGAWKDSVWKHSLWKQAFALIAVLLMVGVAILKWKPEWVPEPALRLVYRVQYPDPPIQVGAIDKSKIVQVVTRSQELELHFYQYPRLFHRGRMSAFWLEPTAQNQALIDEARALSGLVTRGSDWAIILASVRGFIEGGRHYGNKYDLRKEAANSGPTEGQPNAAIEKPSLARRMSFAVRSVKLLSPRVAVVKVSEQWYCPLFNSKGLVKERGPYIGPSTNEYFLVKRGQQWLLFNSTVPRFRTSWSRKFALLFLILLLFSAALTVAFFKRANASSEGNVSRLT